ncbi:MAG: hypothetical protein HKM24_00625 [Gammaproteobacteria bacterium]|nr:hypothetical protein [Gammaproteobacteria bacterium]
MALFKRQIDISTGEAPKKTFPKCPHCQSVLKDVWVKNVETDQGGHVSAILCPSCEFLLNITSSLY